MTPATRPRSAFKEISLLWQAWWRRQTPSRQDRFAFMGPLTAVIMFFAAISSAFWYLRYEEMERERESVRRDVESAQQQLRLRLIERQEQMMRLARDAANGDIGVIGFSAQAEALVTQFPELSSVSWLDARRRIRASYSSPSSQNSHHYNLGEVLRNTEAVNTFQLARELRRTIYSPPLVDPGQKTRADFDLQLHVPILSQGNFEGVVMAEYNMDGLIRFAVPSDVTARHAVSLMDAAGMVLAGQAISARVRTSPVMPWTAEAYEFSVPVSPVGNSLILRAQAYRTSQGLIGNGLFWLVGALSVLTAWMLIGSWRHTRRRLQAQQALIAETNFRRAMENSILTGMRAMDLQGQITYVNAAFCQMTGWTEQELVGLTPPFPYWPEEDRDTLTVRLQEELSGRTSPSGIQVRVLRKDHSLFAARLYVSPLVDARGQQTGWMTSMTDITEPNRIRDQLAASYERFTTVLEALDASVSVAPLGSEELLFANGQYRLWFGNQAHGHLQLITQAGMPPQDTDIESDDIDSLAGLPTMGITTAPSENAEIFITELGKWLEVRSRYLNWVDGRLAQMVIATDITPRRQAEEQAEQQAARAQNASRLITMGEMASSVAHELNQPLTAINNYCNGMVSRLKAGHISEPDMLIALEKTARQAQRAGQIIQRIRAFVKRSEPNRVHADVAPMVFEALELAEIELRRRNVRLSRFIPDGLPKVMVDVILIEQVLLNLLKNAAESIDHAQRPSTHRHVALQVGVKRMGEQEVVEFSVTDSGQGLAPQVLERLFEAFYSTKAEGMGIGLNLCRSIVESHLGRMQAENLYNGSEVSGCCFSFWLPVSTPESEPQAQPAPDPGVSA
jgi:hypothetical protein